MKKPSVTHLPIALRVYPEFEGSERVARNGGKTQRPDRMLVIDTETTTNTTQRLLFGSYRLIEDGRCLEEGLFLADDMAASERQVFEDYVNAHVADTDGRTVQPLRLLSLEQFLDRFYRLAYKMRFLVVGFNIPFDLSRIACDATAARGRFAGGFSLGLWSYNDLTGNRQPDKFRPRIAIKHIDSKRALKGFTARLCPDLMDLIPEDSKTEEPKRGYIFRGHFLDLRTLAFALTNESHSLASACKAFSVEHPKQAALRHGVVSEAYIDYNRRDVLATYELAEKLLEEYDKHPIELPATQVYSPASIGKAYLQAMGIVPVLERQPDFPQAYLGYAQSAFFGGRTSVHIRKVPVPVVYTDFLSMYPTVNSLMGLWRFVIAKEIRVVEHCQAEIESLLRRLTPEDLFRRGTWSKLTAFVRVVPDGDILPSRSRYSSETNDWQVAVNHLSAGNQSDPPCQDQ